MDRAVVIHPNFPPGRRIVAVSDIHGNLPFFRALLDKIALTPEDILVLVGDLLEKGQESLTLLRYVMDLCRTHTVYPLCGNCDGLVYRFFRGDELDGRFFSFYLPQHPESTLRQLAREGGFDQTEDLPRLRADLRAAYPEEHLFLSRMPTILETEHLVFVHGGVPSLGHMDRLDRWGCMKNDDFLDQGHVFRKWVVVGHWPVTLYHRRVPTARPLVSERQHIISIDGGCVLKLDGQLNALIIPDITGDRVDYVAYDGLRVVRALDRQEASKDSLNIRWSDSAVEVLRTEGDCSWCRHLSTGRELWIMNEYLYPRRTDGHIHCEDTTDYALPVEPGERLALVRRCSRGYMVKKHGATGWYFGRVEPAESK